MREKQGSGSITNHRTTVDEIKIQAVQWYDNTVVTLALVYCVTKPFVLVRRFFKSENKYKEIKCIVIEYNGHMGGVDLQDSLLDYQLHLKVKYSIISNSTT